MTREIADLRFQPLAPADYLALIEGAEQFQASFGLPVASGLREYICSDDVSPTFLALLRDSQGVDPWRWGFAVVELSSELVVGTAGYKGPPDATGVVEIAYGIAPGYQNRGYATWAARQLVAFAQGHEHVRIIRAHTLEESNASTRVLEKNGFRKLGVVDDPEDGPVWRWELV